MTTTDIRNRTLAQTLAVQSQIHLAGTVGRLLKQIRDIERIAPLFIQAGLVRPVERPNPLDLRVAGISTRAVVKPALGGFLYVAAATRIDIAVESNMVSTVGHNSISEIDDIDFDNQSKRLQLINIRQAYKMVEAALESPEHFDLILLDCPLLLNRSMVPPGNDGRYSGLRKTYDDTVGIISSFWRSQKEKLFPWNARGPVVAGIASERYGAIVQIAQQDLRTAEGRNQILSSEMVDESKLGSLIGADDLIVGVGRDRFVNGILGNCTRTVAFKLNVQTPRMEPADVVERGVFGFHFKTAHRSRPNLLHFVGSEREWNLHHLDKVAGQVMAVSIIGGREALALPIQLAAREQRALDSFIDFYRRSVSDEIKGRGIEDAWLSDLDAIALEGGLE